MAIFNDTTLSKSSFKLLQNKAHTANSKESFNENESTVLSLGSQEIFGKILPFDPAAAVAAGLAGFVSLNLALDPSSSGKGYLATIITVAGTDLDGHINPRTGLPYADGDRVGYIIPPKFDEPPPPPPAPPAVQSYRAILKNNGTEVPPSDASNWYLDYRAGIVVSEINLSLVNGTVECYVHIGSLLSDRLDLFEASGTTWLVDGLNIRNNTTGNVLPDIDLGASLGDATNRWASLNVGPSSLHVRTIASESGGTARDWNQHIDLPSGNMNIAESANVYFTVRATGQVGIGTTLPVEHLTISSSSNALGIEATSTNDPLIKLKLSGVDTFSIGIDNSDSDNFKISRGGALGAGFDDIIIQQSDGKIGLGSLTPQQKLQITGSLRFSPNSESVIGDVDLAVGAEANVLIVANSSSTVGTPAGDVIIGSGSASALATASYTSLFPLAVPRLEYLRILGVSGNVGIGITNPTQKLQVGTLIVADSTNVRIGIGTAAPTESLHVNKTNSGTKTAILIENPSNSANASATIDLKANTTDGSISVFEDSHVDGGFMLMSAVDIGMHLRFDTENTEKMRIESNGNVGIGTTSPLTKLHIKGGTGLSIDTVGAVWATFGADVAPASYMRFNRGGSSIPLGYIGSGAGGATTYGTANDLSIRSDGELILSSNGNIEQIRIDLSGNVGIGSSTPGFPLQVVRSVNSNTTLEVKNLTSGTLAYAQTSVTVTTGSMEMQAISTGYTTSGLTIANTGCLHTSAGLTGGMVIATDAAAPMIFGTSNTERMRILSTGNVGIGVTNPAYDLQIGAGTVTNGAQQKVVLANFTNGQRSSFSNVAKDAGGISVEGIYEASGSEQRIILGSLTNHEVQIRTNNSVRQTWLETGEVGIGTTNPTVRLSLGSSIADTKLALWESGANLYGLGIQGSQFRFHTDSSTARFSFLSAPAGIEVFTIKGTGNVGIGSTNPPAELTVAGDVLLTSSANVLRIGSSTATAYLSGSSDSIKLDSTAGNFVEANSVRVLMNSEANMHFYTNGTASLIMTLDVSEQALAIGVSTSAVQRLDVRGPETGTDTIDDFIAQVINTDAQAISHSVLHLGMSEATTSSSDRFLVCTSNDTGIILGTVEFYIDGQGGTGTSLTAQHWVVLDSEGQWIPGNTLKPGMLLSSSGTPWIKRDVETAIPIVKISSQNNDKKVFGVLSSDFSNAYDLKMWEYFDGVYNNASKKETMVLDKCSYSNDSNYHKARANSGGEGKIWVTNYGGNIQNGDYITTSNVAGYGMLQDDDILHSYTVAKCTQDIDWDDIDDAIIFNNTEYKTCLIICTYHCG